MKNKLKGVLFSVLLGLSSTSALADVFYVDVLNGTTSFNHANVPNGYFYDEWNFNVFGDLTADGMLSNYATIASQNIDFFLVTLNGISLDVNNYGNLSFATLDTTTFTGPLQLIVSGLSGSQSSQGGLLSSSYSGNLNIQNIQAVPELETYAMLLAGLALIGFSARNRKKS